MYKYEEIKPEIFTENGSIIFTKIRDKVKKLLYEAGAFRMNEAIKGIGGNSWQQLACIDRLVELGEIKEITKPGTVAGQDRIFTTAMPLI